MTLLLERLFDSIQSGNFTAGAIFGALAVGAGALFKKHIESALSRLFSLLPTLLSRRIIGSLWEQKLRKVMAAQHNRIRLPGIRAHIHVPIPRLEEVYVDLELQHPINDTKEAGAQIAFTLRETFHIATAISKFPHLVILGLPGAGKTTLLEHVVAISSKSSRKNPMGSFMPLYIPLRSCKLDGRSLIDELIDPSTGIISADLLKAYPKGFFEYKLEGGRCILLFDGMDEVIDEARHVAAARLIDTCSALYPKSKILVTSRVAGWRSLLRANIPCFIIRSLSTKEIERMVKLWYNAVITAPCYTHLQKPNEDALERAREQASQQAYAILTVLRGNSRLLDIATTPLMLSLMCLVYYQRHDLPEKRLELYEECTRVLLSDWDTQDKHLTAGVALTLELKINLLKQLASALFENANTDISEKDLVSFLSTFTSSMGVSAQPSLILRNIEERSGLLCEKAIKRYGFTHLTFQEYFTALGLLDQADGVRRLSEHVRAPGAEEVVLLFAGGSSRCNELLTLLLQDYDKTKEVRLLLLIGSIAAEGKDVSPKSRSRIVFKLNQEFDSGHDEHQTIEIQKCLERLGVRRHVVRTFDDFEILDEIGRGGFATTFKAIEQSTKKTCVLKVYRAGTNEFVDLVAAEIKQLTTIKHPSLVNIQSVGVHGTQMFVSMEYVDGGSLYELLVRFFRRKFGSDMESDSFPRIRVAEGRSLSIRDYDFFTMMMELLADICAGIHFLHGCGIAHCDIKSSNMLVFMDGRLLSAKVSDYCIDAVISNAARIRERRRDSNLTILVPTTHHEGRTTSTKTPKSWDTAGLRRLMVEMFLLPYESITAVTTDSSEIELRNNIFKTSPYHRLMHREQVMGFIAGPIPESVSAFVASLSDILPDGMVLRSRFAKKTEAGGTILSYGT